VRAVPTVGGHRFEAIISGQTKPIGQVDVKFGSRQAEILNLRVAPEYRRQMIGSGLVQRAIAAARTRGIPSVTLIARPAAGAAPAAALVQMYQKLGFRYAGATQFGPRMTLGRIVQPATAAKSVASIAKSGVVQRMQEDDETIGSRARARNDARRAFSPRRRDRSASPRRARVPMYREQRVHGMWDGERRPGWYPETWDALWVRGGSNTDAAGVHRYRCVKCLNYFYREIDKPHQDPKTNATIDHKDPYRQWILDHAAPDNSGEITSASAMEASNDLKNLDLLCQSCNSTKNGVRGLFA
jgi:hypothetical protein